MAARAYLDGTFLLDIVRFRDHTFWPGRTALIVGTNAYAAITAVLRSLEQCKLGTAQHTLLT